MTQSVKDFFDSYSKQMTFVINNRNDIYKYKLDDKGVVVKKSIMFVALSVLKHSVFALIGLSKWQKAIIAVKFHNQLFSILETGVRGGVNEEDTIIDVDTLLKSVKAVEGVIRKNKKEFFAVKISKNNYQRLTVKAGVWMAFRGVGEYNMLLNLASVEHDPSEAVNIDLNDIRYEW